MRAATPSSISRSRPRHAGNREVRLEPAGHLGRHRRCNYHYWLVAISLPLGRRGQDIPTSGGINHMKPDGSLPKTQYMTLGAVASAMINLGEAALGWSRPRRTSLTVSRLSSLHWLSTPDKFRRAVPCRAGPGRAQAFQNSAGRLGDAPTSTVLTPLLETETNR